MRFNKLFKIMSLALCCLIWLNSTVFATGFVKIAPKGFEDWYFIDPSGLATDRKGNIYVADKGNNCIKKFDNNGRLVDSYGSGSNEKEQFDHPEGVAVDSKGYICCRYGK